MILGSSKRVILWVTLLGENGQVIDHDQDVRTLHLRVFNQLGRVPVLLKKVTSEPDRELVFRSPRFERGQT